MSSVWRYIKMFLLVIIFIAGVITTIKYILTFAQFIDYKFKWSSGYKYEQRKINEQSTDAYILGRARGVEMAQEFDSDKIDQPDKKDLDIEEIRRIAVEYYYEDEHKPTPDELKVSYGLDFASSEMPVIAYESGYIDAFVDYILQFEEH